MVNLWDFNFYTMHIYISPRKNFSKQTNKSFHYWFRINEVELMLGFTQLLGQYRLVNLKRRFLSLAYSYYFDQHTVHMFVIIFLDSH